MTFWSSRCFSPDLMDYIFWIWIEGFVSQLTASGWIRTGEQQWDFGPPYSVFIHSWSILKKEMLRKAVLILTFFI